MLEPPAPSAWSAAQPGQRHPWNTPQRAVIDPPFDHQHRQPDPDHPGPELAAGRFLARAAREIVVVPTVTFSRGSIWLSAGSNRLTANCSDLKVFAICGADRPGKGPGGACPQRPLRCPPAASCTRSPSGRVTRRFIRVFDQAHRDRRARRQAVGGIRDARRRKPRGQLRDQDRPGGLQHHIGVRIARVKGQDRHLPVIDLAHRRPADSHPPAPAPLPNRSR